MPKKKSKKKVLSKIEKEKETQTEETFDKPAQSEKGNVPDELEGERTVRKSTRTSVIVRQAERDAIRAALQATMKVRILENFCVYPRKPSIGISATPSHKVIE